MILMSFFGVLYLYEHPIGCLLIIRVISPDSVISAIYIIQIFKRINVFFFLIGLFSFISYKNLTTTDPCNDLALL